jgi:hypothetical protein
LVYTAFERKNIKSGLFIESYRFQYILFTLKQEYSIDYGASRIAIFEAYCKLDRDKTGASGPRGGCARDFVNFRGKKSCIARARRGRAGLKGPRPDLTMTGRCDS